MDANTKPVSTTKKIIAREGLIIIGILAISGLCALTSRLIKTYDQPPPWEEISSVVSLPNPKDLVPVSESNPNKPQSLKHSKGRLIDNETNALQALKKKESEAAIAITDIDPAKLEAAGRKLETLHKYADFFDAASIFILFFAYPLYLIGRFITWAIRTLRR